MTEKIIEAWAESTIIQGSIALMSVATVIYLAVVGKPIPDILNTIVAAVLGFYFGQKTAVMAQKIARERISGGG